MRNKDLIEASLDALEKIREENILDNSINMEIDKSITKVKSIIKDDKVKIAILGEFSSGKSTFINAILRDKLLSYADEPTTANNTYISYGPKEKVTINFKNGSKKSININQIEEYTKEGVVKSNVDSVRIEVPNTFLNKGITIIDTPGANIDNESHNMQRAKAIEECSMGIFIVSINSLTSKSFIEFLKKYKDRLGKFIFVISKCDMLEESTLDVNTSNNNKIEEVVNYVRQCIIKFGQQENPEIYPISAYNFLYNKESTVIDVNKTFTNLMDNIEIIHKKEKNRLILFEICKVLEKICTTINTTLRDKNRLCEIEIRKVNGEIESFDRFVFNNYKDLVYSLDKRNSEAKETLYKNINDIKLSKIQQIKSELNNITTMIDLKNSINQIAQNGIQSYISSCENNINKNINKIGHEEFKNIEKSFKNYFENLSRTYKKLGIELIIKLKAFVKKVTIAAMSYILSSYTLNIIPELLKIEMHGVYWDIIPLAISLIIFLILIFTEKDEVVYHIPYQSGSANIDFKMSNIQKNVSSEITEGHGFGAGAIAGAIAGGPIGALIGAAVGTWLSGAVLKDRINYLKSECMDNLTTQMDNIENQLHISIDDLLLKNKNKIINEYKKYVGDNMGLYKSLLDGIYKYNNNKFLGLRSTNDKFKYYLKLFQKINNQIKVEKSNDLNKNKAI